jgi:uncharacterized protein involved in exopolysaccharide biosynthesis
MDEHPQQEASHLWDYLQIVRKRFWLILAIGIIAGTYSFLSAKRTKPIYRATAQVLIQRYNSQVVKVEEVLIPDAYTLDYYPTQYKLLTSRALAREVIERLGLDRHPEFNRKPEAPWPPLDPRQAIAAVLRAAIPKRKTGGKTNAERAALDPVTPYINAYLGKLKIEPVQESRLVNISFTGYHPELMALMANTHAQVYIDRDLKMKLSAAEEAVKWLEGRLGELKQGLQESEVALQQFQEQENIVALKTLLSGPGGSEENMLVQRLEELNSSLTAARTERLTVEPL